QVGQVGMPAESVHLFEPGPLLLAEGVEEAQLHPRGDLGKQREVRPRPIVSSPEGRRSSRPHLNGVISRQYGPILCSRHMAVLALPPDVSGSTVTLTRPWGP